MFRLISRLQPGVTLRNYAAATLLNLALVSTILTPPDREYAAQTRIVKSARHFRDTELIDLDHGEVGVLSVPLASRETPTMVGMN